VVNVNHETANVNRGVHSPWAMVKEIVNGETGNLNKGEVFSPLSLVFGEGNREIANGMVANYAKCKSLKNG